MARVKKFDVWIVPVEVKYEKHILGRLFGALAWLMVVRMKKFNLTINNRTLCSFYRLIVPHFLKGSMTDEE